MNEPKKSGKGKVWAWVAGILIFIVVALYTGWHYFKKDLANPHSKIVKPVLTDQLKKMIREASDSLYHIEYDKFDLNIDSGMGVITNFKLIPDSAVYRRLLKAGKAPNNVFHIRTDSLILNKFGFVKTSAGRRFNIAGMVMKHPVINVVNKRMPYNSKPGEQKTSLLMKLAKDIVKITSVQKLTISNMNFTLVNQNEKEEKSTTLKHLNINMEDFIVDKIPGNKQDSNKKESHYAKVKLFRIATRDSLYDINFRDILFSPEKRSMSLSQFSLVPRLSKTTFYNAAKYDKDRIHLVYKNMTMRNIDIERFLHRQQIHIGTTTVGSSWGEVANNYHWPKRKPPLRPHPYPHQKLQDIAFDVTIDTMKMHNGYFQYVIYAKKSEEKAVMFMTSMEGTFTNITNNTLAKSRNPYTVCNLYSKFMGAGNMRANYTFNLTSKSGAFSTTVSMGAMDGRALNPLAKPLAMMAIKSANLNKMYMHIDANRYQAKGNINLYYTNMKVNLLKRDDEADTLKKRGFLSFFTNVALPNDNPKKNGKFRKGPINITRDPHDSFFGLLWKCSLDGMSSAMMGFDQKKQKPNENFVIKVIKKIVNPRKEVSKKQIQNKN
jgi:hypothetical protein